MLGIFLQVLKIIGIVLLSLLGIVLLLVLIALFVPLRYAVLCEANPLQSEQQSSIVSAAFDNHIKVNIRASWLLHMIHFRFILQKEGKEGEVLKSIALRLFGINLIPIMQKKKKEQDESDTKPDEQQAKEQVESSDVRKEADTLFGNKQEDVSQMQEQSIQQAEDDEAFEWTDEDDARFEEAFAKEQKQPFLQKIKAFGAHIKKLFEKVKTIKYTIIDKLHQIEHTIHKLERIKKVLQSKRASIVWQKVKKDLSRIWKHVKPKCKGNLHIGTGQPDTMGELLGVYGMLIGIMPGKLQIQPEFVAIACDGTISVKGKVALVWFIKTVWLFLFDKDIKKIKAMYKKAIGKKDTTKKKKSVDQK